MKVAILFLFAFVAVSQAAFTANLVQRAQPILAKTFQARFRTEDGLQTTLFQTLQEHANALMEQIQNGINAGVDVATEVYQNLADTFTSLQQLSGDAVDAATGIISNFFGNLFGGNKRFLSGLNLDNIISAAFEHVSNLVAGLDVPAFIENALSGILSHPIVQQVMGLLMGRQRGLFGDLISGITGAASQLAAQVAQFVSNIQDNLAAGLASVSQIAEQMISEATNQVSTITQAAADQLMEALAPYAQDMGALYQQAVAAIQTLVGRN